MEFGLMFRKTSTCYNNPDIEYLDETSDYKLKILKKLGKITEEEFIEKHKQLQKSISYLSKEYHGKVYAGGYIRKRLLKQGGIVPEKWDNDERKKAIISEVYKASRRPYRGALGHKLLFSVSDELLSKVENAGLNMDEMLGREVKKIMYEFQHKFHPGEKIGFAWGIHHDTKHRHAHIYLCNRTDEGNHVALSTPLKGRRADVNRKNQIAYIKERCIAAQKKMIKEVEKINKNKLSAAVPFYKVENPKPKKIPLNLQNKKWELLEMERALISKENQYKLQVIKIRQQYNDFYLRKELIAEGWNDIKKLNSCIAENYQKLKETKNTLTPKLLRELGYVSNCGAVKFFSRMLARLQREEGLIQRQALLERLDKSKEYKRELLSRVQILDAVQKNFHQNIKELKKQKTETRKQFYLQRRKFEGKKSKFNRDLFKAVVSDPQKRNEYFHTTQKLWQKRKNKEDCSIELEIIRNLDLEAREKLKPKRQAAQKGIDQNEDDLKYWNSFKVNYSFFKEHVQDTKKVNKYQKSMDEFWKKKFRNEDYSRELSLLAQLDDQVKTYDLKQLEKNYLFFCKWSPEKRERKQYKETYKDFLRKHESGKDCSTELKILQKLDAEVSDFMSGILDHEEKTLVDLRSKTYDLGELEKNYLYFCEWSPEKRDRKKYKEVYQDFLKKYESGENCSLELKLLQKFDSEVRDFMSDDIEEQESKSENISDNKSPKYRGGRSF